MTVVVSSGKPGASGSAHEALPCLGKYQLLRRVAIGGMAELFLARAAGIEGFEKLVILKKILPHLAAQPRFVRMFLNEARLAATLNHPNIAQVYDIGMERSEYFFTMEYVHGQDVRNLLRHAPGHCLPVEQAITIASGLCAGLHHAHEHRDPAGKPLRIVHRAGSP